MITSRVAVSQFPGDWGKLRQVKLRTLQLQYCKKWKTITKNNKNWTSIIIYLLTWNRGYIYNKISIRKPLLKHLHININNNEQQCSVNEVYFLREYLTLSIILSTKSSCSHTVYSTNSPIYLTLFPSPFTNRASASLFVNISFFSCIDFFLFHYFY